MKKLLTLFTLTFLSVSLLAQLKFVTPSGATRSVNEESVSPLRNSSSTTVNPLSSVSFSPSGMKGIWVRTDASPIFFREISSSSSTLWLEGNLSSALSGQDLDTWTNDILQQIQDQGYLFSESELVMLGSREDATGKYHADLEMRYRDFPVYGSDIKLHLNGRRVLVQLPVFETDLFGETDAVITEEGLEDICRGALEGDVKWIATGPVWDQLGMKRSTNRLVYFSGKGESGFTLCWEVKVHPNLKEGWTIFVDATTGSVVDSFRHSCNFHEPTVYSSDISCDAPGNVLSDREETVISVCALGPEEADAVDLLGQTRRLKVFQNNGLFYLIDGSRPMFDGQRSVIPDDPVGAIWTIDARGTSPVRNDFSVRQIQSANNTWTDRASVSAHYNAQQAYEYFVNNFGRNSINGSGGNIISLINVAEEDGGGMDNAFWNGAAIFYGNGRDAFQPLARGLDVAGHEMSHGVIQHTANLEYLGESGAMNEAYADIFGAMVDREDWKIGEDVVRRSFFPSGALRDMSDPHNGGNRLGDPGWQPRHYNERYQGNEDNGGVHINSGIINHAYYLFATDVGRNKAERIFYHALQNYLTRSSQFRDLRVAVEASITDLFGGADPAIAAAKRAFDEVGIPGGGSTGGKNEKNEVNPGDDLIVFTTSDYQNLYVATANGQLIFNPLTRTDPLSRPSVTDDGSAIVFVGTDGHIHVVYIDWENVRIDGEDILSAQPIWRNVAVAKDGSVIAALTDEGDNIVHVFGNSRYQPFELYNPTYTQGVSTGDVLYADALEFDVTGEYLIYDAFNFLPQTFGGGIEYWDIGFMHVWDQQAGIPADGEISKLFGALPEGISIGNPGFAKNSPFVICFDQVEEGFFGDDYFVRSADLEANELGLIFQNSVVGYPNFSRTDEYMIFNAKANSGADVIGYVPLDEGLLEPAGNAAVLFDDVSWGVWFSNGTRDLNTSTEEWGSTDFLMYPNPVEDELVLKWSAIDQTSDLDVEVFNIHGSRLRSMKSSSAAGSVILDMDGLAPGTYIVVISHDGLPILRRPVVKM